MLVATWLYSTPIARPKHFFVVKIYDRFRHEALGALKGSSVSDGESDVLGCNPFGKVAPFGLRKSRTRSISSVGDRVSPNLRRGKSTGRELSSTFGAGGGYNRSIATAPSSQQVPSSNQKLRGLHHGAAVQYEARGVRLVACTPAAYIMQAAPVVDM